MAFLPVLIYANKQDMDFPMTSNEIIDKLNLLNYKKNKWLIQPACAKSGDGLFEGMDWLAIEIKNRNKEKKYNK